MSEIAIVFHIYMQTFCNLLLQYISTHKDARKQIYFLLITSSLRRNGWATCAFASRLSIPFIIIIIIIAIQSDKFLSIHSILVMDKGIAMEFDSPSNLLEQKGIFYDMAKDAGLA